MHESAHSSFDVALPVCFLHDGDRGQPLPCLESSCSHKVLMAPCLFATTWVFFAQFNPGIARELLSLCTDNNWESLSITINF